QWLNSAIPANPGSDVAAWPLLRGLIPHAEHLSARFPPGGRPEPLALVLNDLAMFHTSQGQHEQALTLRKSALAIYEDVLGLDHPYTGTALNNLAGTYRDLGQPDKGLPLVQRALKITEDALGPDHPDTAIRLNVLALTYRDLGQPDKGLPLLQRAL